MKVLKKDEAQQQIQQQLKEFQTKLKLSDEQIKLIFNIASARPGYSFNGLKENADTIEQVKYSAFINIFGKEIVNSKEFESILTGICLIKRMENLKSNATWFVFERGYQETALADMDYYSNYYIVSSYLSEYDKGYEIEDYIIVHKVITELWCFNSLLLKCEDEEYKKVFEVIKQAGELSEIYE